MGIEVKDPDGVYEVGKMGKMAQPEDWSEEKTRNETDIIKTRVTKMIEQQLRDDPYAQEAFSKLLRQVIEEAEKEFDHPLKQHMLFKEFEEQVEARRLDEILMCSVVISMLKLIMVYSRNYYLKHSR